MKVLEISRFAPVPYRSSWGYGGDTIEQPASVLQQMGHEINVIAPVPWAPSPLKSLRHKWQVYHDVPTMEIINKIPVYHPRYLSFPNSFLSFQSGPLLTKACEGTIRRIHKQIPFEIIHAHFGYPDGYLGARIAHDYRLPLIITLQATDVDVTAKLSPKCFKQLGWVIRSAKAVISPTDAIALKLKALFDKTSTIIYYGFDAATVYQGVSPLRGKYGERFIIMSVCQLIPSKGVDINLFALADYIKNGQECMYVIVGNGPDRDRLDTIANSLGIREYVDFVGSVSHDKAMEYISICDVFTMPSWQETFGLVYVEAMANGKPIIGCRGQGIDEIIERNTAGIMVLPKEVSPVVKALQMLSENQILRKEMGENGRRVALQNLTYEQTANRTLAIYQSVHEHFYSASSGKS